MKTKLFTIGIALVILTSAQAQVTDAEATLKKADEERTEGWKAGGLFSLSFSQVSLSNWAAGGQNSLSGNGLASIFADYGKEKLTWNNTLDIGYGLLKQQDEGARKSDDKIDLMSKLGILAAKDWYYAGLVNFRTQMAPGYNYPDETQAISNFLSPAYIVGAIGMDYKPGDDFTLFLAPVTGKMTIVNDEALSAAGAFGVEPGEKSKSEFGGYLRAQYRRDVTESISLQTKIDLFSNYLDKPLNLDVNWEALVMMNLTRYITVSFATHLIYDEEVLIGIDSTGDGNIDKNSPRVQFKQLLGVGLSYRF